MAYKCTNNLAPPYLCDRFVKRTEVHQRATRNRGMLQIPHSRTSTGQRSFHYRGIKIWNELDSALKHIPPLRVFKSRLREDMVETFLRSHPSEGWILGMVGPRPLLHLGALLGLLQPCPLSTCS